MKIEFKRRDQSTYTLALRDDGVTVSIPTYDRTSPLPHDIAHYIVERGLGLKRGFWGQVAAGAMFPNMQIIAGHRPLHADAKSQAILRESGQQGTEAEVLVGLMMHVMEEGSENDWPRVQTLLKRTWQPGKPSRKPIRKEEVQYICAELREVRTRWQQLSNGESLTFDWMLETHVIAKSSKRIRNQKP